MGVSISEIFRDIKNSIERLRGRKMRPEQMDVFISPLEAIADQSEQQENLEAIISLKEVAPNGEPGLSIEARNTLPSQNIEDSGRQEIDPQISPEGQEGPLVVQALCSFSGGEDSLLSFEEGDIIEVLNRQPSGWWDGLLVQRGWFPSNYVQVISKSDRVEASIILKWSDNPDSVSQIYKEPVDEDEQAPEDFCRDEEEFDADLMEGYQLMEMINEFEASWEICIDEDGFVFNFNTLTGQTEY